MSRRLVLLAVTLPVLAIGLGIVQAERTLRRSRDFVLEIGGYDPRDLLRGRYLRFRLVVDPVEAPAACAGVVCCVCLSAGEPGARARTEQMPCAEAREACDGWLTPEALARSYRFYVPETRAAELEERLREAMQRHGADAVIALANGVPQVRELRIDAEPVPGGIAR